MGVISDGASERPSAFPRVQRYLARLPHGIDSHPECVVKASAHRTFCESRSLRGFAWHDVPPKVAQLLRTPFEPNAWVSQVASLSAILAVADHHRLDDEEAVAWFRDCNVSWLSSAPYASMLSLASPEKLIQQGAARWAMLHRGIGFGVTPRPRGADATVTYPPFLYSDLLLRGQAEGFRTALAMSRAKDCRYTIVRSTPRTCEYHFDWS